MKMTKRSLGCGKCQLQLFALKVQNNHELNNSETVSVRKGVGKVTQYLESFTACSEEFIKKWRENVWQSR